MESSGREIFWEAVALGFPGEVMAQPQQIDDKRSEADLAEIEQCDDYSILNDKVLPVRIVMDQGSGNLS